jgi:hypothetical protein
MREYSKLSRGGGSFRAEGWGIAVLRVVISHVLAVSYEIRESFGKDRLTGRRIAGKTAPDLFESWQWSDSGTVVRFRGSV